MDLRCLIAGGIDFSVLPGRFESRARNLMLQATFGSEIRESVERDMDGATMSV